MLRFDVDDGGGRPVITGHFLMLDRPAGTSGRLRFTWGCSSWPDPTVQSVVTVSVEPDDTDPAVLTIEHSLLPPNLVNAHELGWTQITTNWPTCSPNPRHQAVPAVVVGSGRGNRVAVAHAPAFEGAEQLDQLNGDIGGCIPRSAARWGIRCAHSRPARSSWRS